MSDHKLKVALLQIMPGISLQENREKGDKACRTAAEKGADVVLFPEMWSTGYDMQKPLEELEKMAVSSDNEFVQSFGKLASELHVAIAVTYLEKNDPLPRNTLSLFDSKGRAVLKYAKVHTCDFGDEKKLMAGDDFYTAELETKAGRIRTGAMICFDREFPESARILMLQGAEIILVPNACPLEINRLSQLRGRAYENMLGIAVCNYPSEKNDCNGHSAAFDGVAYLPDQAESRDTCIMEAGTEEGVYMAEFDMDLIRRYRSYEVHGNAYRHPDKYHMLTEERIEPPFIRKDYRKV
ncbi:MAG: carbon-nitrogen hydrolase family protein [Butyrivibrio sp.]|jgi:predicted amidohydrolase|nr:carbon-nitrogen hydrolase family protein [Butyrivibrio sp.]